MARYSSDVERKAARKLSRYKTSLKIRHNMTVDDFEELLASQDFKCAICGIEDPPGGWCIDHDHSCCNPPRDSNRRSCGKCVRGILCQPCNKGLGNFKDDIGSLLKAVEYLRIKL